ncbi:hypothetical protein Salat_0256400 [Sesamum alatum]|uniref:Uncharacterized protein n=1 Tax=Sesamum alatum TaxID=300844 RepID=A0AAE1YYT4_9LAMI|nr:hypothetical protein Salat_0256400 [Sesamum alatum]
MELTAKRLPPPARPPTSAVRGGSDKNFNIPKRYPASFRSHNFAYRGVSTAPGSRYRFEMAVPENRLRRRQASKEIVRRALTPPCQRPSWRWRNFRPTPSRFSNISTV